MLIFFTNIFLSKDFKQENVLHLPLGKKNVWYYWPTLRINNAPLTLTQDLTEQQHYEVLIAELMGESFSFPP